MVEVVVNVLLFFLPLGASITLLWWGNKHPGYSGYGRKYGTQWYHKLAIVLGILGCTWCATWMFAWFIWSLI